MATFLQPADLGFFSVLVQCGSLTAAARELGISTPAVSKRLTAIENRIETVLVTRTTRRMSLTPEGELLLEKARAILGEINELEQQLVGLKKAPQGTLRVNTTLGFGREQIAPLISRFALKYPKVDVQLQLSVNPPPPTDNAFDVCIRFGSPPESRSIARFIAPNRRIVVASPEYLKRHGTPQAPSDLVKHACIGIRQGDEAYGQWRFKRVRGPRKPEGDEITVKVRGNLTTNDGGVAVNWALDGHGILLRAEWDVRRYVQSGRLVEVLADWAAPEADIYAVFSQQLRSSARVRAFVAFVSDALHEASGG
jgi:LysR family transcriptional activator of dmlA